MAVTLHTNLGDIKCEIACDEVPKAAEKFGGQQPKSELLTSAVTSVMTYAREQILAAGVRSLQTPPARKQSHKRPPRPVQIALGHGVCFPLGRRSIIYRGDSPIVGRLYSRRGGKLSNLVRHFARLDIISMPEGFVAASPRLVTFVLLRRSLPRSQSRLISSSRAILTNFLALCASGYYDGTVFHRNIKGFMIQGGDPTGTGKGGTSIWGKKFNDEIRESLKHNARGVLAMANSGPNTNGSQFFIIYAKQPHLNGLYTVFGKVIHGFEVLDLMEKTPTGPGDRPLAEIRMNRVTIHANPLAG
ncbi:cyclophilin-like peptidyl-prolyl cis-trans isomerase family protein [Actinidia rufa]|uniref:Cyclophilin-like peptidyl-prolyl cis-trans isomerase family protein n=1 Tax=Actinidia rufa TaxID=165716 RepID=A0A7J0DRP3_9ERIC|nr:cyclophilin-like peptidyl-prolyl cis-trans isomerase family protein [Actinidia rufa]